MYKSVALVLPGQSHSGMAMLGEVHCFDISVLIPWHVKYLSLVRLQNISNPQGFSSCRVFNLQFESANSQQGLARESTAVDSMFQASYHYHGAKGNLSVSSINHIKIYKSLTQFNFRSLSWLKNQIFLCTISSADLSFTIDWFFRMLIYDRRLGEILF